jgi:N-acetylglucosaminyl-diphospho-decaprenol L-rhamnosyltransferase
MDLSILIVSYNTINLLDNCLQSILNYKGDYKIEVIVVDNNSNDETKELLSSKYAGIKKIFNNYNYGFAVGMNQAYKISEGRIVMTFNPDAEIFNESIDAAISHLDSNPDIGLLGMLSQDSNGLVEVPCHSFKLFEKSFFLNLFNPKPSLNSNKMVGTKEVEWVWGTSIFARKKDLGETFFVENNFLFWEEYWLCKKVKEQGLKIKILLEHKMLHHISASFKKDKEKLMVIQILGDVNGHKAKINEFGKLKTLISYVFRIIDHSLLLFLLQILSLIKKNQHAERELSIIFHKSHIVAFSHLLLKGQDYQTWFQKEAVKFLNKGITPPLPPQTSAIWVK